jgi:O-antigen ligase
VKILIIAAIPALLALLIWAVIDLERFVVFLVLPAIVFPASLAKPDATNVDAADILLIIALVSWLINNALGRAPDPWIRRNWMLLPAVLFLAVNAASLAWSVRPHSTLIFTIQLTELIILYPLVLSSLPTSAARLRQGLYLVVWITAGLSVIAIAVYAGNHHAQTAGTYLPGINKNALGTFLVAGAVLGFALWLQGSKGTVRTLLALASLIDIGGTLASDSRGAMLGGVVGIVCVAFLLRRRRLAAPVVALALAGVIGVAYLAVIAPSRVAATSTAGSYNSTLIRHLSWRQAIHKIEANPWLGTGARTYEGNLGQYGTLPDPNNLFLLTWAELGIPGMITLGFLLFRFAVLLVRARRLPDDISAAAVGAGGVAVSLIVHFQVDISWVRGETTLEFAMIGVLLALTRLARPASNFDAVPAADPFVGAAVLGLNQQPVTSSVA